MNNREIIEELRHHHDRYRGSGTAIERVLREAAAALTLTDSEREAIKSCIADDEAATAYERADTLRALLKKLGSDRHIGG